VVVDGKQDIHKQTVSPSQKQLCWSDVGVGISLEDKSVDPGYIEG
jgi:hypothetical protein